MISSDWSNVATGNILDDLMRMQEEMLKVNGSACASEVVQLDNTLGFRDFVMGAHKSPLAMYGIPVILSDALADKRQRRTHRKKRVNKKWRKRYGFVFKPDKQIYISQSPYGGGKQIIAHPRTWEVVRVALERERLI